MAFVSGVMVQHAMLTLTELGWDAGPVHTIVLPVVHKLRAHQTTTARVAYVLNARCARCMA
jgi:hypothetical protein